MNEEYLQISVKDDGFNNNAETQGNSINLYTIRIQ